MRHENPEKPRADRPNDHGAGEPGGIGTRGVTRPMPLREAAAMGEGHEAPGGHGEPHGRQRYAMLRMHHQQTLWVYWILLLLGVWMVAAPFAFGYLNPAIWVAPSGGRGVWFSERLHAELRAWLMAGSDVLAGLLLVAFGWRSLKPDRPRSLWACCFVGVWLTLAPVLFWAPTAAAYLNDTLVGLLVIALSVLIPGMPNMALYMRMGGDLPPGWSYNPASWPQRAVMIGLAFAGLLVSRYLAAYQLGYVQEVWDPFFGEGTRRVLDSEMSHGWPISDAALGVFAYTFEFLMLFMGGPARWRTMPWMVTFFGILVVPLGLVHIFLVSSQPVVVGAWSTPALLAALIMIPMIPLAVDEVVAMGQHLARAKRSGTSLWEAFWKGGPADGATSDERSPNVGELPDAFGHIAGSALWGMSFPWTLAASAALGVGLMFVPGAFEMAKPASDVIHVGGALIFTTAVVAMGEPVRAFRYLNVLLGLAVAVLPWLLGGGTTSGQAIASAGGLALAALALPRGEITERYGSWDRFIR